MRLAAAAKLGNTTIATDAYGTASFRCQFEPINLTKIDGVAVRKRSVSIAPGVTLPARGAIRIDGEVYLAGHAAPDYWHGSAIRRTVVIQGADGLAQLARIHDVLAGAPGVQAYAALVFSKYLPDNADSSKYPPQYQIFVAGNEDAPANSLVKLNDVWYLVKESYVSTSGLRIVLANTLEEPVLSSGTLEVQTYNVATDSFGGAITAVQALRVKWQEHFKYLSKASETYVRGDQQVFLPKAVTPVETDLLRFPDGAWRILAVQDEGAHWSCHVRRH